MGTAPFQIDLRSDTVTKPTREMRQAMANADVGDDVIGTDPTVELLQSRIAEILGKEAALFMPSGSMTNQIAIRVHCRPGDEFICEADCHVYNYEQAAYAQLSGVATRTVPGTAGVLHVDQLRSLIRPDNEHQVRTRLVCLENTHNRGAGAIQPFENVVEICNWAHANGLQTHLDGARLFNAAVATGIPEIRWAENFDSVSVCFSKGLGAPVGSALVGSSDFIKQARRARKLFGGAMRQVGILAAGALYGLEHHRKRLCDDHENAQLLANTIRSTDGLTLEPDRVQTNIVIFKVDPAVGTASHFVSRLARLNVGALAVGPQKVRLVTHLDVNRQQIEVACAALQEAVTFRAESPAVAAAQY